MSADGLATPLGMKPRHSKAGANSPLLRRVALFMAVGILLMVLVASIKQSNKSGGEPIAVAVIERMGAKAPNAASQPMSEPNTSSQISPRANVGEVEGASGVKVIRQNGGSAPGAMTIRVPDSNAASLAPAPDPRVSERAQTGILPRIGPDGQMPRDLYARPYKPSGKPMVAILLTGVGIGAKGTADAISKLPGDVTLAFAPYGRDLEQQVLRARRDGHEVMLQVPMEPFDYPESDPGPHTLRSTSSAKENIERLHWLMTRFSGYTGLTNYMGAKLMGAGDSYGPILEEMNRRGLFFVDDGTAKRSQTDQVSARVGLPVRKADRILDGGGAALGLPALLSDIERIAREKGSAILSVPALPAHIDHLAVWIEDARKRGIDLAPISAVIRKK